MKEEGAKTALPSIVAGQILMLQTAIFVWPWWDGESWFSYQDFVILCVFFVFIVVRWV